MVLRKLLHGHQIAAKEYVREQQLKGNSIQTTRGKAKQALQHLETLRVKSSEEAPSVDSLEELAAS